MTENSEILTGIRGSVGPQDIDFKSQKDKNGVNIDGKVC